jgi:uncharacterized protein YegP (UPF0339 family)
MKYELYKDKIGEWRWRLKAANGEILAFGEGYKNKADCQHCIGLIKASSTAPVIEL